MEVGTGSLGQGLSIGAGLAYSAKMKNEDFRVYVILGDGELQEGQIWEAIMAAAHFKIDNLCAFVDYNNLQIDGYVEDVMGLDDLPAKWKSFNWHVIECDGHDMDSLFNALDKAKSNKGKPTVIIGRTVKGKGVSFMEDKAGWHGRAPDSDELETALCDLGQKEGK